MRFLVRASSLVLLWLLAAVSFGQAFGRFGYQTGPTAPGFAFSAAGFRVTDMPSDTFRFLKPLTGYRLTEISDRHAVYSGADYAGMPSRIRTPLQGAGFEFFFPLGIEVRLTSLVSPFVSWAGGTIDSGNPSAPSTWLMVSFQDRQAPVLFTFEAPVQMLITGKAGDWRLRTTTRYMGWVKICLLYTSPSPRD